MYCLICGFFQLTTYHTLIQKLPHKLPATHKPMLRMHFYRGILNTTMLCLLMGLPGDLSSKIMLFRQQDWILFVVRNVSCPLHLHTSLWSQNSCSWDFHSSNFTSFSKCCWQSVTQASSAFSISWVVIVQSVPWQCVVRDLKQRTNFCTYSTTLNSLCNLLNFWQSITVPIVGMAADTTRLWLMAQPLPFISSTHLSGMSSSYPWCGGDIIGSHCRLCNQHKLDCSSLGEISHEGMLAGLSFPGQWDHWVTGTNSQILVTLLRTNCFHSLVTPWTQ